MAKTETVIKLDNQIINAQIENMPYVVRDYDAKWPIAITAQLADAMGIAQKISGAWIEKQTIDPDGNIKKEIVAKYQ